MKILKEVLRKLVYFFSKTSSSNSYFFMWPTRHCEFETPEADSIKLFSSLKKDFFRFSLMFVTYRKKIMNCKMTLLNIKN